MTIFVSSFHVQSNNITASQTRQTSEADANEPINFQQSENGKTNNAADFDKTGGDEVTENVKACWKIREIIEAPEAQVLGLEKEFDAAFVPTASVPFDEDAFNKAYDTLKAAVEKKRQELGISGKMDASPQGQADMYIKMLEKGGASEQDTLSSLSMMQRNAMNKQEKKAIEAATKPYMDALKALQNGNVTLNGTDKTKELQKALYSNNKGEIINILDEVNSSKKSQSSAQNSLAQNSVQNQNEMSGFSDLFKMLN